MLPPDRKEHIDRLFDAWDDNPSSDPAGWDEFAKENGISSEELIQWEEEIIKIANG